MRRSYATLACFVVADLVACGPGADHKTPTNGTQAPPDATQAPGDDASLANATPVGTPETPAPIYPTIGGVSIATQFFFRPSSGAWSTLKLTNYVEGCLLQQQSDSHKAGSKYFQIELDGSGLTSLVPGTYPTNPGLDGTLYSEISLREVDANCVVTKTLASGAVTLTAASATSLVGTFTATFATLGTVTGAIDAAACAATPVTGAQQCGPAGSTTPVTYPTGTVTQGTPATLEAQAVGAYAQIGSTCPAGSDWTGHAMFLCPGGHLRAAGKLGNTTELMCGTYTASPAVYPSCTDKVGCFPKVKITAKDTLTLNGQSNVDPSYTASLLLRQDSSPVALWRSAACTNGSSGYVVMVRIAQDVGTDYCVSSACSATGATAGSYGQCGTDCDCGKCWYCESNTCRFGGEGPLGCYRGCSG